MSTKQLFTKKNELAVEKDESTENIGDEMNVEVRSEDD